MTAADSSPAPLKLTIPEMKTFMTDLDECLKRSGSKEYPGTAHVAMPKSDLERIGAIRRFFENIAPHEDDVRRAVAAAIKRMSR